MRSQERRLHPSHLGLQRVLDAVVEEGPPFYHVGMRDLAKGSRTRDGVVELCDLGRVGWLVCLYFVEGSIMA